MPSARFLSMRTNIRELRRLLLPKKFDPTGSYAYPKRVSARTLSFRVLVHAEIETYFEDRAVEICRTAWSSWKERKNASSVILHLLAYSGRAMTPPPQTLAAPPQKSVAKWNEEQISIYDRLEKSVSKHVFEITQKNHGIKEKDIMFIILPIGFDTARCDQLMLTNLNQFGIDRGAAAHSSTVGTVTNLVDPKSEYDKVKSLAAGILQFDVEFDRLLGQAT